MLIFAPAMKGTSEGSYGWDLNPNGSMTNATVAIPDGTPVVTLAPAGIKDLVAAAPLFVPATKGGKGGKGGYWEDRGYEWYAGI